MSEEKIPIDYGFVVMRHESVGRIELEPTTWRHIWYRFLYAAVQVALLTVFFLSMAVLFGGHR